MDNNLTELLLDSGWWVRCRKVPPIASYGIMDREEFWMPPPPMVTVETMKGAGSETMAAPVGSPEYQAYEQQRAKVESARNFAVMTFVYAYGVHSWSKDRKKWSREVPEGWELDDEIRDVAAHVPDKIRTQFIIYELISTQRDQMQVEKVCRPTDLRALLAEEVQAAEDMFPGDVEGDAAAGDGA